MLILRIVHSSFHSPVLCMIAYWSCFTRVGGLLGSCFRFGEIIKTVKVKITVKINTDYNACILARIHAVFSAFGIILFHHLFSNCRLLHLFSPRGKLIQLGVKGLKETNSLLNEAVRYKPKCVLSDIYRIALTAKYATQLKKPILIMLPEK